MFLGFEDSLRDLKKELKAVGVDMSYVKEWQKSYDKVRKQSRVLKTEYTQAKVNLEMVYGVLQEMEQQLIARTKNVSLLAEELKKYQNSFNQEFLIGKEDSDFHSTFQSILSLSGKDLTIERDLLILQSEVENLLAVTKEALEKKWPDFREMAFFYIAHTDKELLDFPHGEKVEEVAHIYEREFYRPMLQMLENALGDERAKRIMEVELWI